MDSEGRRPDVIVMDLQMAPIDGIESTRQVRALYNDIEVMALTSFAEEDRVHAALQAGASGYVLKDSDADDVAGAIRAAHRGELQIDPVVARRLMSSLREARDDDQITKLTPRERDVLRLVAQAQQADRRRARHQRAHGQDACIQDPRQAPTELAYPGGALGGEGRTRASAARAALGGREVPDPQTAGLLGQALELAPSESRTGGAAAYAPRGGRRGRRRGRGRGSSQGHERASRQSTTQRVSCPSRKPRGIRAIVSNEPTARQSPSHGRCAARSLSVQPTVMRRHSDDSRRLTPRRDEKAHGARCGPFHTATDRKVRENPDATKTPRHRRNALQISRTRKRLRTTENRGAPGTSPGLAIVQCRRALPLYASACVSAMPSTCR